MSATTPAELARSCEGRIKTLRSELSSMTEQRDGALITMRRQGLSYSEIADATGMSRNTIKSITRHVKMGA